MARTFSDIGSAVFDFFFGPDDYSRSVAISSSAGPTSFSVARDNKDDNSIETYLKVSQELNNSILSSLSFTTSDASNPSLSVDSNALKSKHISLSSSLSDPNLSLSVNFNDQDKYALECELNTNFDRQELESLDISAVYDSLLNKKLLNEMNYSFAVQYEHSEQLTVGLLATNNLQNVDMGVMYDKFRGNESTTLYGKLSTGVDSQLKPEIDYSLGLNYTIDEDSSLDFIVNKNNTSSLRYSVDNESDKSATFNFHAFVAAHLDFNHDAANRAKLQYGISIE